MYDDPSVRLRLTSDILVTQSEGRTYVTLCLSGSQVRTTAPSWMIPMASPNRIPAETPVARVIAGIAMDRDRADVLERSSREYDLW